MPYNIQMWYILFCVCVQGWGGEGGVCYHDILISKQIQKHDGLQSGNAN